MAGTQCSEALGPGGCNAHDGTPSACGHPAPDRHPTRFVNPPRSTLPRPAPPLPAASDSTATLDATRPRCWLSLMPLTSRTSGRL